MNFKKGFTLIEVLIVVAIIGILASIVLVGLGPARQSGQDARRLADVRGIQTALELYYRAEGTYPANQGAGDSYQEYCNMAQTVSQYSNNQILPSDPRVTGTSGGGCGSEGDYVYASDGSNYVLGALLDGPLPAGFQFQVPSSLAGMDVDDCGSVRTIAAGDKSVYCVAF